VRNIVVLTNATRKSCSITSSRLASLRVPVFDYIDIRDKFVEFLNEYSREHSIDHLAIIKELSRLVRHETAENESTIDNIVVKSSTLKRNYPALIGRRKRSSRNARHSSGRGKPRH